MTIEERADAIVASTSTSNIPHPNHPGKRIVGWIVDENLAGLSDALFAMDVIRKRLGVKIGD